MFIQQATNKRRKLAKKIAGFALSETRIALSETSGFVTREHNNGQPGLARHLTVAPPGYANIIHYAMGQFRKLAIRCAKDRVTVTTIMTSIYDYK